VPELIASSVERYAEDHTSPFEGALAEAAAWTHEHTGAPEMMAGLVEARLLEALIVAAGARHVLEIGAFTGVGERIELIVGDALESIARLEGPFDLVWIDAWKSDYPAYYDAVFPKLSERGVIAADNVLRTGAVLDPGVTDQGTLGIREFAARIQEDERVHNVLLTIGDGVMLAWRRPQTG
jgi:caffeoyl-CoA O-methyltransferase